MLILCKTWLVLQVHVLLDYDGGPAADGVYQGYQAMN